MADHHGQADTRGRIAPTDPRFDRPRATTCASRAGSRPRWRWWLRLARLWPALPVVTVSRSASRSHDPLARSLSRELAGVRVTRPVLAALDLPASTDAYLRGRSRQALRTNLRKADQAGLRAMTIGDVGLAREASRQVAAGRLEASTAVPDATSEVVEDEWFLQDPSDRWFAVVDADDRWVAFAGVATSSSAAYLRILYSATAHADAGPARYRIHTLVVSSLVEAGVERLWADGPLTTSHGSRYFQHLLGYYCARPSLRRHRRPGPWPGRHPARGPA